jgi:acyl-coenzyme A thioesterase PaaI-like protein
MPSIRRVGHSLVTIELEITRLSPARLGLLVADAHMAANAASTASAKAAMEVNSRL